MKILWITNTIFPAACKELGIPVPVVGGWMYSSAKHLIKSFPEINLGVASLYNGTSLKILQVNGITYFLIPSSANRQKYNKKLEKHWQDVNTNFKPDLVHIHGSEYPHGLAYVNACGKNNVVVSIQGLVTVYERNYYGGISENDIIKYTTIRDLIRNDSLFKQRKMMQKRAHFEKELLKKVDHVIGRTSWDKTHSWAINPGAEYHFCNETLRDEFYQHSWNLDECEKHTIFLSQAHYPIKGLHQMVKALPLVLREYPDTQIYVAGNNFFSGKSRLKLNGYGKYILNLLMKYNISQNINFTGVLSEKQMSERYLKSHVFVCPSSIENSPNSVGEAQLLGVPCITSYVGGAPEMVTHEQIGLVYRFEEFEMLAKNIIRIFNDDELSVRLSKAGREVAHKRHSQEINTNTLNDIYEKINYGK